MRPRHKAAENADIHTRTNNCLRASMRPRHKAAENVGYVLWYPRARSASMRPRHKAAENSILKYRQARKLRGFNEAAA